MKAEVIAVGTEILLGQIVNSNAAYISQLLAECGIDIYHHSVVGDNNARLEQLTRQALARSDLVIFTGGLGPTSDDLTKETVAAVLGRKLVKNEQWERELIAYFKRMRRELLAINLKQALIPEGAMLLPNSRGTAPGILIADKGKIVVLLPGPPREMQPMFRDQVIPELRQRTGEKIIKSRVLKIMGAGESAVVTGLQDLIDAQTNPTIATLVKGIEVHLRLTAKARTAAEAMTLLDGVEEQIRQRLGALIYGKDDETLESVVAALLFEQGLTLAVAESCTGGLVSDDLTNIPGSSRFFYGGVVAYADQAKAELLGVDKDLLAAEGAVSEAAAAAMAAGIRRRSGVDLGLSITGIAGPEAPEGREVGLIFIGLASPHGQSVQQFNFVGERRNIKERAARSALNVLCTYLLKKE